MLASPVPPPPLDGKTCPSDWFLLAPQHLGEGGAPSHKQRWIIFVEECIHIEQKAMNMTLASSNSVLTSHDSNLPLPS